MAMLCKILLVVIMGAIFLYVAREGAKVLTQVWNTDFDEE